MATFDADRNETTYTYDKRQPKAQHDRGRTAPPSRPPRGTPMTRSATLIAVQGPRVRRKRRRRAFPQDPKNPVPFSYFDEYYTYDAMHRQVTETDGDGDTTSTGCSTATATSSAWTTPNRNTTTYTYDELDTLLSVNETARMAA